MLSWFYHFIISHLTLVVCFAKIERHVGGRKGTFFLRFSRFLTLFITHSCGGVLKDGCDNGGGNQAVRGWYRLHMLTPSPSSYQSAWPWFDSSPPDPFPQLQSTLKEQQTEAEPKYLVCTLRGQLFVMTTAIYMTLWLVEDRTNDGCLFDSQRVLNEIKMYLNNNIWKC